MSTRTTGQSLSKILTGESGADALSPSGLPLTLVVCADIETIAAEDRGKFEDTINRARANLRAGRWWLSYDERSFYDQEIRSLLTDSSLRTDPRLEELASIARLAGAVPLRRDEPTRYFERGEAAATMIVLSSSQKNSDSWQGAALTEQPLRDC